METLWSLWIDPGHEKSGEGLAPVRGDDDHLMKGKDWGHVPEFRKSGAVQYGVGDSGGSIGDGDKCANFWAVGMDSAGEREWRRTRISAAAK